MAATDVGEVQASMRRAERKIESALNTLVAELGSGWMLSVDVGTIDVSTLERHGWTWRAEIEARMKSAGEAA